MIVVLVFSSFLAKRLLVVVLVVARCLVHILVVARWGSESEKLTGIINPLLPLPVAWEFFKLPVLQLAVLS